VVISVDVYIDISIDMLIDIHMVKTSIRKYVTFHCDIDELRTYLLGEYFPHQVHQELKHT
jgi:hypothetical protein